MPAKESVRRAKNIPVVGGRTEVVWRKRREITVLTDGLFVVDETSIEHKEVPEKATPSGRTSNVTIVMRGSTFQEYNELHLNFAQGCSWDGRLPT